ncbi:TRM11 family SAM-dependent methyltransferase [Kribbella sp.]|uniref:TRM11 family SAM-dependent methyltransferase n=1 Tax=Kribbella sp. TaxID=1871183 RepID=UPI002D27F237|nr:methyltransferase domain-containing protein [Kribbella sp.]HZX07949.1 methyltransferase domain-containing protein [Kribbella sp.]
MLSITDHLVLRTIDGAADLLVGELRAMPSVRSVRQTSADTVACTVDGPLDELAACPLYSFAEVESVSGRRLSWTQRFGRSERLPWSTNLIAAEVLVRLAKIRPGHRLLDPFCGTGTILRAAHRHEPAARLLGVDRHRPTVHEAFAVVEGRAEALPLADRCVDRVVANLPFGKLVGSHRDNRRLYPAALAELDRVLTPDGRVVLLTEDKRLLRDAVQQSPFKIVRERLLRYNGATPTAYVLTRARAGARARAAERRSPSTPRATSRPRDRGTRAP